MDKPVFAIGDVHGKHELLAKLLRKAGICDVSGKRTNFDVEVVCVGDLGNFTFSDVTDDLHVYEDMHSRDLLDISLWGNHDWAEFCYKTLRFNNYSPALPETRMIMNRLEREGRLIYAFSRHGYLLTHAGLHPKFVEQDADMTAEEVAENINETIQDNPATPLSAYIPKERGGASSFGGILWRDEKEPLAENWPQIFGHSRGKKVRQFNGNSYCIDVPYKLTGMWLPTLEIVQI